MEKDRFRMEISVIEYTVPNISRKKMREILVVLGSNLATNMLESNALLVRVFLTTRKKEKKTRSCDNAKNNLVLKYRRKISSSKSVSITIISSRVFLWVLWRQIITTFLQLLHFYFTETPCFADRLLVDRC